MVETHRNYRFALECKPDITVATSKNMMSSNYVQNSNL